MNRRSYLATAVVAASAGCLDILEENGEEIREPEDIVIVDATLLREHSGTDDERVFVRGTARNEGERTLNLVEIRATFYDGDGEELNAVIENVPDVTAGDEWTFEIEFPEYGDPAAAVADYELEVVTGV